MQHPIRAPVDQAHVIHLRQRLFPPALFFLPIRQPQHPLQGQLLQAQGHDSPNIRTGGIGANLIPGDAQGGIQSVMPGVDALLFRSRPILQDRLPVRLAGRLRGDQHNGQRMPVQLVQKRFKRLPRQGKPPALLPIDFFKQLPVILF